MSKLAEVQARIHAECVPVDSKGDSLEDVPEPTPAEVLEWLGDRTQGLKGLTLGQLMIEGRQELKAHRLAHPTPLAPVPAAEAEPQNQEVTTVSTLSLSPGEPSDLYAEMQQLMPAFETDEKSTHGLSAAKRDVLKIQLVAKYRNFCERFAASDSAFQNAIYQHWTVWLLNTGNLPEFIQHCRIAQAKDQRPQFLRRDFYTFCYQEVCKYAESCLLENRTLEVDGWLREIVADYEQYSPEYAARLLAVYFKLLARLNRLQEANEWGLIGLQWKAKIKTELNEVRKTLQLSKI